MNVAGSTADPQVSRPRPYASPLRRQQAQNTRTQIARAARDLFRARGWTQTRVRDVAAQAGVSEATVYATYGSKAGLAKALVEAVEASADALTSPSQISGTDPTGQLAALLESDRRLFADGGDVIALLRDAGRAEPDLRGAYREDPRARRPPPARDLRRLAARRAARGRKRRACGRCLCGAVQHRRLPRADRRAPLDPRPGPGLVDRHPHHDPPRLTPTQPTLARLYGCGPFRSSIPLRSHATSR